MNTRHSRRITPDSAERLLGGSADDVNDPLARVLAAAAARGREDELGGEAAAVSAFEAHHLGPVSIHRRGQMIKSPLAKLLTAKAIAAGLAVCVTGGVAVAASTGALTARTSAKIHLTAPNTKTGTGTRTKTGTGNPSGKKPGTASKPAAGPARLCRTLATRVASAEQGASGAAGKVLDGAGLERALANPVVLQVVNNPAFTSLVSAVQAATAVPDYCALLLGLPKIPDPGNLMEVPSSILAR
ncbi:MAG TPA: hypothetical protein VN714_15795, partial [Trebonia sp.]|nr:hypothetical protein [Trebonia sp.]